MAPPNLRNFFPAITVDWLLLKTQHDKGNSISWGQPAMAASHLLLLNIALLLLYGESAHTVAMIRHTMDVVRTSVDHLN